MAKRTRKTSSTRFNVGKQRWVLTAKGYVRLWDPERKQYSLVANQKSPTGTLPGGMIAVTSLNEAKALAEKYQRSHRFANRRSTSAQSSPSKTTVNSEPKLQISVKALEFLEHVADTCGEIIITTSSKKAFNKVGLYLKEGKLYRGDEVFDLIDKS